MHWISTFVTLFFPRPDGKLPIAWNRCQPYQQSCRRLFHSMVTDESKRMDALRFCPFQPPWDTGTTTNGRCDFETGILWHEHRLQIRCIRDFIMGAPIFVLTDALSRFKLLKLQFDGTRFIEKKCPPCFWSENGLFLPA